MPLRFLDVKDRYARLLIKIPETRFYVFYTGDEDLPLTEEGIYTKAIEIARNLIEMGMSAQNIGKPTGLSYGRDCKAIV